MNMTRNMQKTLPWHFNYAFAASNQADRIELLTVQSGSCIRHTSEERSVISTDDSAGEIKCCYAFGGMIK